MAEPLTADLHNGAGGAPSTLLLEGVDFKEIGDEPLCEDTAQLDVTYELAGEEGEAVVALFVAKE